MGIVARIRSTLSDLQRTQAAAIIIVLVTILIAMGAATGVLRAMLHDLADRTAGAIAATVLATPDLDAVLAGEPITDRSLDSLRIAAEIETVETIRLIAADGTNRLYVVEPVSRDDGRVIIEAAYPLTRNGARIGAVAVGVDLTALRDRYRRMIFGAGFAFAAFVVFTAGMFWRQSLARAQDIRRASFYEQHDALTGLPNRRTFRLLLATAAVENSPHRGRLALLLVDLVGLGAVNDIQGHEAGDAVLKDIARRFRQVIAPGDIVARLEGDRFAIVRVGTQDATATGFFSERVARAVSTPIRLGDDAYQLGARIGVAMRPQDGEDADALIGAAEIALRRAKSENAAGARFFELDMDSALQDRRALERDMQRDVAEDGFQLRYQPQVSLADQRITGFEALMRWPHPIRGMVSPAVFIPLAENTGAIHKLGVWALRRACLDALTWPQPWRVSVNTSPLQFGQDDFAATVSRALNDTGLPPERLEIEVTESVLIADTERVLRSLRALKDIGVRVSMDDFGTGYSSLSYLWRFPFDKLKVDQAFVRHMTDTGELNAIVGTIVAMGKALNLNVTAEGVETPQQLDDLRRFGCDEAQGFLIGAPITTEDIAAFAKLYSVAQPQFAGTA